MQEQDTKISKLFKEKKKSNRKIFLKETTKALFCDNDKSFPILLNKKRKTDCFPILENIKIKKEKIKEEFNSKNNNNNSKNYLPTGHIKIKVESNNSDNNSNDYNEVKRFKNEKDNDNHLEISTKTKNILNKILADKKNENEKSKILDQYNIEKDANNFIKKEKKEKFIEIDDNYKILKKNDEPPKLSLKTIEILQKLKDDRKNRFERPQNSNEEIHSNSSFSTLHLKYDELIAKKRELRLPIKYKELFNAFVCLESIINLNKVRFPHRINTFENIKNGIEAMTHHSFNLKKLQQILYIVPHFYILKYVKKNEMDTHIFKLNDEISKQYDLQIEIPRDYKDRISKNYEQNFNFLKVNFFKENDNNFYPIYSSLNLSDMKKREDIFRNILDLIVNIYHQNFLNDRNIKINFNPLEYKTWHHKFDPDTECEDIPLFEIPLPPVSSPSVFQSTIMKNDIKDEIMKDALSIFTQNNNEKDEKNDINNNKTKNKYVSQVFLDKIKAKEKANNIINEIHNYNIYHNNIKDMNNIYKEMLIQIKTILLVNKNLHKLRDIAELVLNSSQTIKECYISVEKMSEAIIKLCKRVRGFISVKNHSYLGPVVVLEDKEFKIPSKFIINNLINKINKI